MKISRLFTFLLLISFELIFVQIDAHTLSTFLAKTEYSLLPYKCNLNRSSGKSGAEKTEEIARFFTVYNDELHKTVNFRSNIPEDIISDTNFNTNLKKKRYTVYRKNGAVFYCKGFCLSSDTLINGQTVTVKIVPQKWKNEINDALLSDCNELTLSIPVELIRNKSISENQFKQLINKVFTRNIIEADFNNMLLCPDHARFNHSPDKPLTWLFPVHKISSKKYISNPDEKGRQDLEQCIEMLSSTSFLLSQNERAKRHLTPDFLKIRWKDKENLDLGSGRNVFVFITVGPGINYFDDPFRKPQKNLPSPRLILSRNSLAFQQLQFFPDYSIGTYFPGKRRFDEFNVFQKTLKRKVSNTDIGNYSMVYMPVELRSKYLKLLEQSILSYGLLNNSPSLEKGFSFNGDWYTGNVINNEMLIRDFLSFSLHSVALIVPEGYKEAYCSAYQNKVLTSGYPEKINGIDFREYFVESWGPNDLGMRKAYFAFLINDIQPIWSKILKKLYLKDISKQNSYLESSEMLYLFEKLFTDYNDIIINNSYKRKILLSRNGYE
ncbi:MAG: hypothetical protein HQM10_03560 [Candidatus Riflebacteria bacterium]|nr:hypothetical protein [Candidatus Riflebacteria bacterium]